MFGLLERVRTRQAEVAATRFGTYREAVVAVADGADAASDGVIAAMEAAGKKPEEFASDVQRITNRRKLRASVDAVPGWQKKMDDIVRRRAEKADAVRAAQREFDAFVQATEPEIVDCIRELDAGRFAKTKLVQTADAELIARCETLAKREGEIGKRIEALKQHQQHQRLTLPNAERNAKLASDVAAAKKHDTPHEAKALRERADEAAAGVVNLKRAIEDTGNQIAELQTELARVQAEGKRLHQERFTP